MERDGLLAPRARFVTLGIVVAYLLLVVGIGLWASRRLQTTREDFFVAGRSIGPFVLLMTLFGTHMTSFSLLGASAETYRIGIGVFGLMASSSAIAAPLVFLFVGLRVWAVGKRHGYVTQVQFVRGRWRSDTLGLMFFAVVVLLLIPYLLIGVLGGGVTLEQITEGQVPVWVGSLLICVAVSVYVVFGGMRGTAWVNTFQTLVFMVLGAVTVLTILRSLGGLGAAMQRLVVEQPDLLVRGDRIQPLRMLSYLLIPTSVGAFPHIFAHWLSARRAETFRPAIVLYPVCLCVVWVPSVLLGLFGRLDFPALEGPATNSVLIRMISLHAPDALAGLLGAGVFAAIMSSLDSQSLSLGSMFSQDVVRHYRLGGDRFRDNEVFLGRLFVVGIVSATFLLSFVADRSIFGLAVWSFTGFAGLLPVIVAALYWRRSTATGATCALFAVVVSWTYFFSQGWGRPDYSVGQTGVMPVAVVMAASVLALVVGSLLSKPLPEAHVDQFVLKRQSSEDVS